MSWYDSASHALPTDLGFLLQVVLSLLQVTPNLYGNLITNVGCGLVGGPGVLAGANYGIHGEAVFEPVRLSSRSQDLEGSVDLCLLVLRQGARHVAADIQGAGVANPTGTTVLFLKSWWCWCSLILHVSSRNASVRRHALAACRIERAC